MSLRIQFLGRPRILRNGQPVELPGYRPLALLAYLVLSRRAYSREHLIDLLFDGPDDPRAALRWTLTKLRKSIGEEFILTNREEVSFNHQSDYWLDISAFEAGETEVYLGDLLEGLYLRDAPRFDDWLIFERQRLRGQHQASLEEQLDGYKQRGDQAAVVITAQELLKLDNLREDWHYALIHAYAQLGKRAAALEQYEKCRQILDNELRAEPSHEIKALIEAIQIGRIGGKKAPSEAQVPFAAGASDTGERAVNPAVGAARRPRSGLSRAAGVVVGVLSLSLVAVFIMSLVFGEGVRAMLTGVNEPPAVTAASQPAAIPPELAGKIVRVMAGFYDEKVDLFAQAMLPFEQRSGITIELISGNEADFNKRVQSGNLPDIALFPQPGRLIELARQGLVINLSTFLEPDYLRQQYPDVFLNLATLDGKVIGAWYGAGLKSLVWYPKQAFEARGYQVPETWEELIALSDQIVADGDVPWCIGIDDFDARGWVGTDWVEDILLRTEPPETYDAWVRHDLPFDSPEVRRAFELMGQIWLNEDYVYGGVENILNENISESSAHLFEDPPGCYLYRQASFAPYFFPPGVHYDEDFDFFYLPPIDPEFGHPVLGSGDIYAMFHDRPEVREAMRYLTTAESAKPMVEDGGFISPHKDTPIEWYPTAADLRYAQILLTADTYRFDGSDMMPEAVGFGAFFRGISDWVAGADLDTVLPEIDANWPR